MTEEIPLDIDGYASEYTGRTAITRLLAVSKYDSVAGSRLRALLLAIRQVKAVTLDYELYGTLLEELRPYRTQNVGEAETGTLPRTLNDIDVLEGMADLEAEVAGRIDEAWLATTAQQVKKQDDKLEAEMRNYSVNLIKESIRLTHHAQATHARAHGDMEAALKSYAQTKDFNSSARHDLESSLGTIEVSLDIGAFAHTLPAVARAEYAINRLITNSTSMAAGGVQISSSRDHPAIIMTGAQQRENERITGEMKEMSAITDTKLRVARGIVKVGQGSSQWASAAREFGGISGKLEDWEGTVVASGDIAVYATLTSLATCNRSTIKTLLLDNIQMRYFMDYGSAAYTRELVDCYMHARYQRLLEILRERKPRHLIDPFLRPVIAALEDHILQNALVQYFQPYNSASFSRMLASFGQEDENSRNDLAGKLAMLIKTGRLQARLDLVEMAMHATKPDPRQSLYTEALATGQKVQSASRKAMLHMQLVESGLSLDGNKGQAKKKPGKKRGGQQN
ncbi:hypothetical protein FFLO_06125 [Filobasidium floriforme]|uniref:PCI domain-containing protein n=1 Tax=Filobasidium floriforme TaxID=5210 RepID=A0A8K0JL51_9TREE|nr:26S proteasome subunit RPN7-domain-containing protein [Filobasidium floriforme]KAG7528471.1 hypothetical protein FFLO_06125 [Filobasidium floriforme]KAH8088602.1 26S proteasome subunit RPN7-domain-containing protein [Filobasidium floriforme]